MDKHWKFLNHTKIANDLSVCHDFDSRSFGRVQGHWKEKSIVRIFLLEEHWKLLLHRYIVYDLRVCQELNPS